MTQTYQNNRFYLRLNELTNIACDNIDDVLKGLGVRHYRKYKNVITARCPVHGGDNPGALNLYPEGNEIRGIWYCKTRQCQNTYRKTFIGLVRGILTADNSGVDIGFKPAIQWLLDFFKISSLDNVKCPDNKEINKRNLIKCSRYLTIFPEQKFMGWTRQEFRKKFQVPSQYFISRGFPATLLDKYDIAYSPSQNRAIIPAYNNEYTHIVGFVGRSTLPKCKKCSLYHNGDCPTEPEAIRLSSKYLNSRDFNVSDNLYNYWFANDSISKTNRVVVVESAANVWRLVENDVHNVVGLYGSSISAKQELLLSMAGAMYVTLLLDNDDAGKRATEQITEQIHRRFHVKSVQLPSQYNDVAEMNKTDIQYLIQSL